MVDTLVKKIQKKAKPVTAKEVGATTVQLKVLEARGLITREGTRPTGKRGRPAVLFVATAAGDEAKAARRFKERIKRSKSEKAAS